MVKCSRSPISAFPAIGRCLPEHSARTSIILSEITARWPRATTPRASRPAAALWARCSYENFMRKWVLRLFLVAVLFGVGIWVWRVFFPSPERAIRERLAEVAQLASFSSNESPLAKAANAQKLTTFCTPEVEIVVDVPGHFQRTVSGYEELFQAALGARSALSSLQIQFLDLNIPLEPDKQTAMVNLTAKGQVPSDLLIQELKFTLKKHGRNWLIHKVQTVKT